MNNKKFVVYGANDCPYHMNNLCNNLDCNDEKYLRCLHIDDNGNEQILMLIPHDRVQRIECWGEGAL